MEISFGAHFEISLRLLESGKSSAKRYQSAFQAKLRQLEMLTPNVRQQPTSLQEDTLIATWLLSFILFYFTNMKRETNRCSYDIDFSETQHSM